MKVYQLINDSEVWREIFIGTNQGTLGKILATYSQAELWQLRLKVYNSHGVLLSNERLSVDGFGKKLWEKYHGK